MSPGPVSDSYDPEFGTSANRADVHDAIKAVAARFDDLGEAKSIVTVVHGKAGRLKGVILNERDRRVIRYCLNIVRCLT